MGSYPEHIGLPGVFTEVGSGDVEVPGSASLCCCRSCFEKCPFDLGTGAKVCSGYSEDRK